MADRAPHPDTPELRAAWGNFAWTEANAKIGAIDVVFGECDR